jgi:para-nitrobenzyl esterase
VSEDCLYLNVWTQGGSADAKRPVLVYIYGGAFQEGSGAIDVYNGETLASRGLVVVTVNYRVGVFGFFAHPELTPESGRGASGNYGLLDQVAALKWVQSNIAAFGGDPGRVTIAGQSAGASSVHHLTTSPITRGLFHRAIPQSGSSVGPAQGTTLDDSEKDGVRFAEIAGAKALAGLRALSANDLLRAVGRIPRDSGARPIAFRPIVDGYVALDAPLAVIRAGRQHDVPTLTGLTADEGSSAPTYGRLSPEDFEKQVRQRFEGMADRFLALYPSDTPEQSSRSQKASARDRGLVSMFLWGRLRAATARAPLFTYYFTRPIPWPEHPEFGAFHSSELPYVFGTLSTLDRPWRAVDRTLAGQAQQYWVNFVTSGDPNGAGLPRFSAFAPARAVTMELGETVGERPLVDAAKLEFWREYFESPLGQRPPTF